jgi:hypothetical protein
MAERNRSLITVDCQHNDDKYVMLNEQHSTLSESTRFTFLGQWLSRFLQYRTDIWYTSVQPDWLWVILSINLTLLSHAFTFNCKENNVEDTLVEV